MATYEQWHRNLKALHEAGHALLAYLLEELTYRGQNAVISIKDEGTSGGYTALPPDIRSRRNHFFMILRAGYLAELVYAGKRGWGTEIHELFIEHAQDDQAELRNFLQSASSVRERLYQTILDEIDSATQQALDEINKPENWHAILKVAEALKRRETITIEEAHSIIDKAIRNYNIRHKHDSLNATD